MASTVKVELDKSQMANLADLLRLAEIGKGLALIARTERLAVAADIAVPSQPARQVLRCFASVGGAPGNMAVAEPEATPGAGNCAVDHLGRIEFANADAITACEITYLPVEEDLISEVIPVTAGGVGTFLNAKVGAQILTATLNAPAVTPAAKVIVDRGTLVGALGAGECAVQFDGLNMAFVAAEAGVACTATVTYHALPGVGTGSEAGFGTRLDAAFTP